MSKAGETAISFRATRPDDASQLMVLLRDCRSATYLADIPKSHIARFLDYEAITSASEKRFKDNLIAKNPGRWRVVACSGDRVVGYVYCHSTRGIIHIKNLFVLPGFRSQGIGRKLLHAALDKWSEHEIRLRVLSTNQRAINLYNREGFAFNGQETSYFGCKKLEMVRPVQGR